MRREIRLVRILEARWYGVRHRCRRFRIHLHSFINWKIKQKCGLTANMIFGKEWGRIINNPDRSGV